VGPDFAGDGTGFKLGISDSPNQDLHLLVNNKSWGNGRRGFDYGFLELVEGSGFYDPAVSAQYPELIALIPDPSIPSDFDGDMDVDGADFLFWQRNSDENPRRGEIRSQSKPAVSFFC